MSACSRWKARSAKVAAGGAAAPGDSIFSDILRLLAKYRYFRQSHIFGAGGQASWPADARALPAGPSSRGRRRGSAGLDDHRPLDRALAAEIGKTEAYAEQAATPSQCRPGGARLERGAREGGKLARLPYDRAEYGEDVGRAVVPQSDHRRRRKLAVHGIDDRAASGKRNAVGGGDSRRDVRFRVHRDCPRLRVQASLFRGIRDRGIGADDIRMDRTRDRLDEW